jgi:glutathione S-transferase
VTQWLTLEQGLAASGLRIAPVRAKVPSAWSELAKACFRVKGIPIALVDARDPESGLASIRVLTAQESLPVVWWNDARPRTNWLEQIHLAERIVPKPALLPSAPVERARIVGLASELCSEDGFGWHRRVLMIDRLLVDPTFGERERRIGQYLASKYRNDSDSIGRSIARCEDITRAFAEMAAASADYLIGSSLTVLDLASAAFAAMIKPLPEEVCPMSRLWRDLFTWIPSATEAPLLQALLTHRDRIYREWLSLPLDL